MILLIGVLVFALVALVAYALAARTMQPRMDVAERLSGYARPVRKPGAAGGAAARWSGIPAIDRRMAAWRLGPAIERLLEQADVPIRPFEFLLIAALCALVLGLIGLALTRGAFLMVLLGALGAASPPLWLVMKGRWRRDAFVRQLPDALQAIAGALRAGFGFNQGIALVASDLPEPISAEFARAQREMNLGLGVDEVLQNMAARIHSIDFDLAVAGISINRQVGGNLAELLDQVTLTVRERVKLKNFIRVLTSQQRYSAWIIMAVPPVLMAALLAGLRDYSSYLITTTVGHILLGLSVCLQLLGLYFIRRIVAIEV